MGSIKKLFKKPAAVAVAEKVNEETGGSKPVAAAAVKKRNAGTRARSRGRSSLISEDRSKTLG